MIVSEANPPGGSGGFFYFKFRNADDADLAD